MQKINASTSFLALSISILVVVLFATATVAAQVDLARRTTAITYPLDEPVNVQFRGTTRFPRMKGEARVKRTSRNGTEIDLSVSKMPRPFELGAGYATYVLWAISPEGQTDNLGEIKRRGFFEFDSKMSVTTKLQTFALIITAEPHFLVARPSQEIMLENLSPVAVSGKPIATTPAVQYFGNSSDFFRDSRTPEIAELDYSKTPSTILQAKQAIALARFAGGERDAAEELAEAGRLLQSAEDIWRSGKSDEVVDVTARRAVSAAVKAENTATVRRAARDTRNEASRRDAEVRAADDRYQGAIDEMNELKNRLADETRAREMAERDNANYIEELKTVRAENLRMREELGRLKVEADTAKTKLEDIESERRNAEAERLKTERQNALLAAQPEMMRALRQFGGVAKTDRGVVLTLPEAFWAGIRSPSFAPGADAKLTSIAQLLADNADYAVVIESHTDDRGTAEELTALTQQRATAISERLSAFGLPSDRIDAKGFGSSIPVAANTTNANRAKNRRIQLILVPKI